MEQTLILNATYEPLKVVDWQRAITLWCQGKVEIVETHDREVRAVSFSFKLPSVVRLLRYVRTRIKKDYVPFTRANIYARDNFTCQYCGVVFESQELTFDHVVPVAQGGRKDWTNIATACVRTACAATSARARAHQTRRAWRCCVNRRSLGRRQPSALRSVCVGRRRAGVRTCIGIRSSKPADAEGSVKTAGARALLSVGSYAFSLV